MTQLQHKGLLLRNGEVHAANDVPILSVIDFTNAVISSVRSGGRISAFFGFADEQQKKKLVAVLAHESTGQIEILFGDVQDQYASLTPHLPQASLFEREIFEETGIVPLGHPWLKPVRKHCDPSHSFFTMQGDEVHEVAVGPVHAGIIEPGHFRFQCHGEKVFHLECLLGYQHRALEKMILKNCTEHNLHLMEVVAGDTSIGHALAFCQNCEKLSGTHVSARAYAIRAIALELERLANHVGDLGALSGDVGYLPVASFCGRIRGDFLNLTARLCGNRFGRGLLKLGGTGFDFDPVLAESFLRHLSAAFDDVQNAAELLFKKRSVLTRFEETGSLLKSEAQQLGLVGPAARACGLERDVRLNFPVGIYRFFQIPLSTYHTGDVFARAYVRWLEIQRSVEFIREQMAVLPPGSTEAKEQALKAQAVTVALVEGWRGEICHVVLTDAAGQLLKYKIVDPSFHNWAALSFVMRNQQISDFPLCNKSFNLSYCGHDL